MRLMDGNDTVLNFWLEKGYFSDAVGDAVRAVFDTRQKDAGLQEKARRLDDERQKIHAEQKRIRENLSALGDRTSEKELRERLVRTLTAQEDRLDAIGREGQALEAAREDLRKKLAELIEELEYDGAVSGQ